MGKTDKTSVEQHSNKKVSELPIASDIDSTGSIGDGDKLVEARTREFNSTPDVSAQVNLNLGQLSRNGFISPEDANTPLSSAFRRIKRPLLNNVLGKGATVVDNANLIMITSSIPNEGKTFTAINLAMSMAMEMDKKILLVDADVSKPSHHEILNIDKGNGLIDYLSGKVSDVNQIIHKTNIPSLSLMFAGSTSAHAIEIIASQAMASFLEELASRYDDRVIILDSAPLLLPTEAAVLASHVGQVVVVIEAEQTGQEMVQQSVDMLNNDIVLLVLNKARQKRDLDSYGYYGYGYGPKEE